MKEINNKDFLKLLIFENPPEHTDLIINFDIATNVDLSKVKLTNKFKNCKFQGKRLDFFNPHLSEDSELTHFFLFDDCEFENDVYFKDCFLQEIKFENIKKSVKNFHIAPKKLGYFSFHSILQFRHKFINDINIIIHNCEIVNYLELLHLKSNGNLLITNCKINQVRIHESEFKSIDINHSNFINDFQFTRSAVERSYIKHNEFNKTNFSDTDFGMEANFLSNNFSGTALFNNLKNGNGTKVSYKSCNFIQYAYFDNSTLYDLHIDSSKFHEFTSFQELEMSTFFLDRTIFEKLAFFDDIEIRRLGRCGKRTLRNIKQQLLRADNKIDYDNFRAHELNSFKAELKKKIKLKTTVGRKKLRRDLTILRVNSFFSNNGTDWVKAIKRTLFVAVMFYSIFYGIHNSSREVDLFNIAGYNEYFIGLFRYFLLTDFHNPLISSREYLSSVGEWIPFLFGKIFIGIGIYEILVSFRKFRK